MSLPINNKDEPPEPWQIEVLRDQAAAWSAVWDCLKQHNPGFVSIGHTGQQDALIEIRRLQSKDTKP